MKKYSLKSIILENCPWSKALDELLKTKKIKSDIIIVNSNTKHKYKNDIIDTFPQLYIVTNKKELLVGGYTETKRLLDIINNHSHESPEQRLTIIKKKFNELLPNYTNKEILYLIKLLL